MNDLEQWTDELTAAAAIGCSVRTLQRYAERGKIERRPRPREGKKPESVYNPRDLARLMPAAHVMPADEVQAPPIEPARRNGHGQADAFFAFLSAVTAAIGAPQIAAPAAEPARPWLTLTEAAAASGLTPAYLRRKCLDETIAHCYGGAHGALLINRASLLEFRG